MEQGPEWLTQRRRAEHKANLSAQRGSSVSTKGIHALVTPGLGSEGHMELALNLQSPFTMNSPVDEDLLFAARCIAIYRPQISKFRNAQRKAFLRLCGALADLDIILKARMHGDVAKVAANKSPAVMALMTVLLRWPDRS